MTLLAERSSAEGGTGGPHVTNPRRPIVALVLLLAILGVYAWGVVAVHPTNFFGLFEDDAIYMSSAQALAEGRGYVLESVPGTPPATKYPVLYAWLLSWIWRYQAQFPANLTYAIAMNVIFGCGYLTVAFLLLRKMGGLCEFEALGITALCALHPVVVYYTANLLSEMPFAAVSLGAILLAGRVVAGERERASTVSSGVLAGFAVLIRVLGVPIAAGLGLAVLLRKGWRACGLFAASALPFIAIWLWQSPLGPHTAPPPGDVSACSRVWQTNWLYYTDYLGFWKADVLRNHVFWPILKQNLVLLFLQPGTYFVEPRYIRPVLLAVVPAAILSVAAWRALFWQVQEVRWQPAKWAVAFYLAPLLLWDYPLMSRFLIPFLPLLLACVWLEAKRLSVRIISSLRGRKLGDDRLAAIFLSVTVAALVLATGRSVWVGRTQISQQSRERAAIGEEKRQAYEWLQKNTSTDSTAVAYEDASLYLYSGRQAMRPVIFAPSGLFRPALLDLALACLTESALRLHATYWVIADDDFGWEWEPATSRGRDREKPYEEVLPLAFRSSSGRVRIYQLQPLRTGKAVASLPSHVILSRLNGIQNCRTHGGQESGSSGEN
jgi:hypothetical protein